MFNEEKDYVFLKKLNLYYIDDDIPFSQALSESCGDSILFTTCNSINTALEKFEPDRYDMVVCDMSFPSGLLNDFFKKFSHEIPIVAISSSKEPKVAYNSARMGAKDYLQKNEQIFKIIPKVLHNVHVSWIKGKQRIVSLQQLDDPNIRIVLKDLINTDLPISQKINMSIVNEIQLNDPIKDSYGIHGNEILEKHPYVLKSLTKGDFVQKELVGQTLSCPSCKSVNVVPQYFCDKCKSSLFEKVVLSIHNDCGKVSTGGKSYQDDKLYCHNCMIYYEEAPTQCNNVIGFQCIKCNNSFTAPFVSFRCNNCDLDFGINQGNWVKLYRYGLNKVHLHKFKKNFLLLMQLENSLKDLGYAIKQYEKLQSSNNTFGPFELVAYKGDEILVFIVLNSDLQYNLRRIFEIDVAANSTGKKLIAFAIEFFELQDVITRLLTRFRIIPLVNENPQEMIKEIKKYL